MSFNSLTLRCPSSWLGFCQCQKNTHRGMLDNCVHQRLASHPMASHVEKCSLSNMQSMQSSQHSVCNRISSTYNLAYASILRNTQWPQQVFCPAFIAWQTIVCKALPLLTIYPTEHSVYAARTQTTQHPSQNCLQPANNVLQAQHVQRATRNNKNQCSFPWHLDRRVH